MNTYCLITQCRYPTTHVSQAHRCNLCHLFGHGEIECRNRHLSQVLIYNPVYGIRISEPDRCKIPDCKETTLHTTRGHLCDNCGKYGHGEITCKNETCELCCLYNSKPNNKHNSSNCPNRKINYIFNENYCSDINNNKYLLPNNFNEIISRIQNKDKIYVIVPGGMGCCHYIRKNKDLIQSFFMHSDNWGQYGTDDRTLLAGFIYGYTHLEI